VAAQDRSDEAFPHDAGTLYARGGVWWVLGLAPATLEPQSEHLLPWPVYLLTVAPDGLDGYAYAGAGNVVSGSTLLRLDLATGAVTLLGPLPGAGSGRLAVTGDRVYVPDAHGHALWVGSRRGRLLASIPVGQHPLDVVVGRA
jgi:hypothetical protein